MTNAPRNAHNKPPLTAVKDTTQQETDTPVDDNTVIVQPVAGNYVQLSFEFDTAPQVPHLDSPRRPQLRPWVSQIGVRILEVLAGKRCHTQLAEWVHQDLYTAITTMIDADSKPVTLASDILKVVTCHVTDSIYDGRWPLKESSLTIDDGHIIHVMALVLEQRSTQWLVREIEIS